MIDRFKQSSVDLDKEGKRLGLELEASSVQEAPAKTGTLRRTINVFFSPGKAVIQPRISQFAAPLKYANAVHEGSRPHIILPKNKKFLAFKKAGKIVFAKKVRHPGAKPNKFFTRAVDKNRSAISQFATRFLSGIIKGL